MSGEFISFVVGQYFDLLIQAEEVIDFFWFSSEQSLSARK